MSTYVVSYDLMSPGQDYDKLYEYLKSFPNWCHAQDSTWVVVSTMSAADVRDGIATHVDTNDKVLVVESASVGAWRGLGTEISEWLKKNL